MVGAVGMAVSQLIVAIVGTATDVTNVEAQRAAIAFVCFYIFFFASDWGIIAWVVTGELFPLTVRAKALSLTTATNWLLNFAIAFSTPYLVDPEHANLQSKVFFVWGGSCLLSIAFGYVMVYETKGLSLEHIDELYTTVSRAWDSKQFTPHRVFAEEEAVKEVQQDKDHLSTGEATHVDKRAVADP